ncbi:MAG: type II toxin-antitoxin system HicB family antitoxin [Acidobacteria bacterium]|nr:type II toxin-antitoxin system HicB family antitoxin [Acidobacteriota bacterium]
MKRTIQVRISKGDKLFVAECLDLPVVTQAATLDDLAKNIQEAIHLYLDGEDLAELGFCADSTIVATMQMGTVA